MVQPTEKRAAVLNALVEGMSINATVRMTGVSKVTVLQLLADAGHEKFNRRPVTPILTLSRSLVWATADGILDFDLLARRATCSLKTQSHCSAMPAPSFSRRAGHRLPVSCAVRRDVCIFASRSDSPVAASSLELTGTCANERPADGTVQRGFGALFALMTERGFCGYGGPRRR